MATLTQSRGKADARRTRKAVHNNNTNNDVANAFPPELQYAIDVKEHDYMGYNGCESLMLRNESAEVPSVNAQQGLKHLGHNLNFAQRAKLQDDLKVRLFLVKKECDLIPPMEDVEQMALQDLDEYNEMNNENEAEDEVAPMTDEVTHEECVERNQDKLDEEEERARLEAEKAEAEHQMKLQEEAAELERLRRLREEEEAERERQRILFEEETKILQACNRTETEMNTVEKTLDSCIRSLLSVNDNGYFVSYLDGTRRHTVNELDEYNTSVLDKTRTALKEKNESHEVLVSDEVVQQFNTAALHECVNKYTNALKALLRYRAEHEDNEKVAEAKEKEEEATKDETAEEATEEAEKKDNEEDLTKEVDESYALLLQKQEEYNAKATENYKKILNAIYAERNDNITEIRKPSNSSK